MGKSVEKAKLIKSLTVLALSSSIVLSPLGQTMEVTKAASYTKSEDILANLTAEQRSALHQLSVNEGSEQQISSEIDLTSSNQINVIVEFTNKPAKVAQIEASVEGKTLTVKEASKLVDEDHSTFTNDVGQVLTDDKQKKINYKIHRSYKHAFSGVSMSLPANQVKNLLKSKVVKKVWSNEKFTIDPPAENQGNEQLKADEFNVANYSPYDSLDQLHAEGYTGKGVKIGILDTGMDYNHPDLKDAYKGGYDFVDNDNDPMETTYEDWKSSGQPEVNGSAYYTEHGTHVAGIIGGRGIVDSEYSSFGAAPEADLYAYRVLGPYGSGTSEGIIAGIDKAVQDGMDVINMSLGATLNDPLYATSIAVNNAVLSGVTTVVAAGNSGDKMWTLGSPGSAALALTVGASSVAIDIFQYNGSIDGKNYKLRQLTKNYKDDLSALKEKNIQIVDVGLGDPNGYKGQDVKGKFVFMNRGVYTLDSKVAYAKAQGAAGVIMANDEANKAEGAIQTFLGESMNAIPSFSVTFEEGKTISTAIKAGKTEFTFGDFSKIQTAADELAAFSSRGPSKVNYDIKPEVTAPGVSILATVPFYINDKTVDGSKPEDYQYAYARLSGTSMATPYVAGVSALLLQSNKDLEPADVKSILMNTADPLSKEYSVFEVGSGRVDAYEAIHSNVEFQVMDKTPTIMNGKQKTIKELTGGISFGSFGFDDQDVTDSRNVILKNRSEKAKTFKVDVKFQTGTRGSLDAAKNNVTLDGPTSVKVNGISSKTINFKFNIPKTAEKGTYEGYITFTNNADSTEQYQIPFGGRVVNEGIDFFKADPSFSTDTSWPANAFPFLGFEFSLKSEMKTLDVLLHDPTTGEDLGLIGSFTPITLNENQEYFIGRGFNSIYYPFTGDSKNPISYDPSFAKPGHYQLRMVGTNNQGKSFSKVSDFIFDLGAPTMKTSFDSLDQKVIEYKDSQFDANGEFLYDFNIQLNDPETEQASKLGLPVDQSSNSVVSFYNSPFPANPIKTDKNGNYNDQILVRKQSAPLQVQFYGFDAARNFTANASNMLRVVFVDHNLPYFYLKPNKQNVNTGDAVNYTVRSNNVKNLKTTTITMKKYDYASIENVVVNDSVKEYGDAEVNVTSTTTNYTFTFTYLGDKELPEDLPLFNFDLKTSNKFTKESPYWYGMSASTIDQGNVETNDVYAYMENFKIKPTYSRIQGVLQVEGGNDPVTGEMNYAIDFSKANAKVTVTSYDGKNVIDVPIIDKYGSYNADGIKPDKNAYTLTVNVPGHFTMNQKVVLSDEVRGETLGKWYRYSLSTAAAGDVNKDNVIDVLDAIELQDFWGTNKASADFNFDKVVDSKDMNYVVKNFGLQNPTVDNAPKAKNSYKGKTLESILKELGMK